MSLQSFFGPGHDGIGRSIYAEWGSKGDDGNASNTEDMLNRVWDESRIKYPNPTLSLPMLMRDLRATARQSRPLSEIVVWPEPVDRKDPESPPVAKSQENIAWFLRHIGVSVYRDEFSGRNRIEGFERYDDLDDVVLNALWFRAQKAGLHPNFEYFTSAVREIARQNSRNPIQDFFRDLKWDGEPRLDTWLHKYAGVKDEPLDRAFGRLFLIAAVRRVRSPGTKFDQLLVLEGRQGAGKSSLALALAEAIGPGLFDDSLLLGAETKNVIELTRGKLIVEISELNGGTRVVEAIKAMLSRREDSARLSYARETSHIPRQFVLIGTTNSKEYLSDATGNRRYWPVEVADDIDLKGLREDALQVWAEAAHYEAVGVPITLPKELHAAAEARQGARVIGDPIYYALSRKLGDYGGTIGMDALYSIIGLDNDKRERREQRHLQAIGRAMIRLGWKKERKLIDGDRSYVYTKEADVKRSWFVDDAGELRTASDSVAGGAENVKPFERREPSRRRVAEG
ncbi:MAG: hypothetical protein ABS54_14365 [Hyphomicrobium sp. SCN 65-11]|nr:MAG: hypothetical protein ABS54_14365 [Hyphomicrobium sp. SCN 65-11]